jgi:putative DNA primase/helicase
VSVIDSDPPAHDGEPDWRDQQWGPGPDELGLPHRPPTSDDVERKAEREARTAVMWRKGKDGKGAIIPPLLAAHVQHEAPTAIGGSVVYRYHNGVYQPGEQAISRRVLELAGNDWSRRLAGEVLGAIQASSDPLDDRPPLNTINLANGLYDLTTGTLHPHTPDHRSPVQLPVHLDPPAECHETLQWLKSTLPPDGAQLFLEIAGYLLTPDNRHQRAFLFRGPGGDGKSVAMHILGALLGEQNVSRVGLQDLDEHRFAAAEIYGRLANLVADLPARAVTSTSVFKAITGGDSIMAERKNRDPFTFRPYARLVFSANETPASHDGSPAYGSRWTILPFPNTFRGTTNEIRGLEGKLTTPQELSGLLNLALATIPKVRARGFTIGHDSHQAHRQFILDSDPVAAFLDECTTLDDHGRTHRSELYKSYRGWCHDSGRSPLARNRFLNRVRDHFGPQITETKYVGERGWTGICLTGGTR